MNIANYLSVHEMTLVMDDPAFSVGWTRWLPSSHTVLCFYETGSFPSKQGDMGPASSPDKSDYKTTYLGYYYSVTQKP